MTLKEHTPSQWPRPDLARPPYCPQRRRLAFATGAVLFLSAISASALADISALGGSADRLRLELVDRATVHLVQAQRNERAREQAIIWRLEEEIRRLNGRIEELEFEQRQTNNRLDQFITDWEQRAVTSESGDGDGGSAGPVTVEQTTRSPEEAIRDLAEQSDDGSLGSVPESAVADLPRPNPADVAAPERSTLSAEQQYENAVQLLQARNYKGAQNGLEVFLDVHKDHQLASNAAYWLAETHYVRQNYAAAAAAFARNYGTYGKESPKAIDNLLKLGMSLSNLGENDKACLSYEELTNNFPNPPAQIQQALNRERARAKCG